MKTKMKQVVLGLFLLLLCTPLAARAREVNILIVYYSVTGHTRTMAEAVAQGAKAVAGTQVTLVPVQDATPVGVVDYDAIILGSPVYNANVAPEIQSFINSWPFRGTPLRDKIGAAFVTAGGISAGEEAVQLGILHSMLIFGMIVVGGPEWTSAFGASAVTDEAPFAAASENGHVAEQFLEKGRKLGQRVAELAGRLKRRDKPRPSNR
jgi:NAD(P)H dehydrogenase (quinone)